MLFFLVIILFTRTTCYDHMLSSNVGSVLFHKRSTDDCWSQDDLAKLRARKIFESVILPSIPPEKINAKHNKDTLKYFRRALRLVEINKNLIHSNREILRDALADTIGGHMRKEILPNARFAYYAGYVPYRSVRELHDFFDSIKDILNTQGAGWRRPDKVPLQNLTVGKILIGAGKPLDACAGLVFQRDNNDCIHIPSPIVDDEKMPAAVSLPFKKGGFISLTSPTSENILLKYYTTAARCILRNSPDECRHADFVNFNNELWHWMKRYVAPHLMDEKLYAGYGGVLRIAAAVQNYGKGLSRRNLFEEKEFEDTSQSKPISFSDNKFFIDADWTPMLCIKMVVGSALLMCGLHCLYSFICGPVAGCHCRLKQRRPSTKDREVAYATVDSNFPAMLPPQGESKYSDHVNRQTSQSKRTQSVGTSLTQRVYDLNENTEKIMSIVMSDKSVSESESSSSEEISRTTFNESLARKGRSSPTGRCVTPAHAERPPNSPPKIDAAIAQLKIEKTPQRTPQIYRDRHVYTASTVTRSGQVTESVWSDSYSEECSESSVSVKSNAGQGLHSFRSSDQGGRRRVPSKHNTRSTVTTDGDLNSCVTTPTTVRRYK